MQIKTLQFEKVPDRQICVKLRDEVEGKVVEITLTQEEAWKVFHALTDLME